MQCISTYTHISNTNENGGTCHILLSHTTNVDMIFQSKIPYFAFRFCIIVPIDLFLCTKQANHVTY